MVKILVIDSDPETERRLSDVSLDTGRVHTVSVPTPEEGLHHAREESPGLILLKIGGEGEGGLDALGALRNQVGWTPIIAIAERASTNQVVAAFRRGACDYVSKPLDVGELEDVIERALSLAGPAEERKRLARQLVETTRRIQRQQQELNAIHTIGRLTTSLLDVDAVLDRLTEVAVHLTDADQSLLLLSDQESEALHLQAAKGLGGRVDPDLKVSLNGTPAGRAFRTACPVLATGDEAQITRELPSRVLLYVPLRSPDRVIGLLGLSARESGSPFSRSDVFLLSSLADYAAIAIENARLFESTSKTKTLMDNVFSSVSSGVIALDSDDQVTLLNRAAREILRRPEARIGALFADVFPILEHRLRPSIKSLKQDSKPKGPFEFDLTSSSGRLTTLRASLAPLRRGSAPPEGVTIVVQDLTKERRLESRYRLFQRFLSPAVIERLPDDPRDLALGGSCQEIACMFADLRGFVRLSTRHRPETLVSILNEYLRIGTEAVLEEEGTLDKLVGDGVIAFFNAPLAQEEYVLRAVKAGLRMRERTLELHERMAPSDRLNYGIGISAGEAVVGNIGTPHRLDYTAIGSTVNMANRLEAAAKPGQILLTSEAYERTSRWIDGRPLVLKDAAGSEKPIRAYEVLKLA